VPYFINSPDHDLLSGILTAIPKPLSRAIDQTREKQNPTSEQNAYFSPAVVAREAKDIEKTWQLSQKYFLTSVGLTPMCDRLQYGRIFSA
jgi:hypothetical protein